MPNLAQLPCRGDDGAVRLVIESPRGSMVKLKWEPELSAFLVSRVLPLGTVYPYDWGFVPSTLAPDGDPLDGMLVFDAPNWPGVVVSAELIGVVRLTQKSRGKKTTRNDRLILVAQGDHRTDDARSLPAKVRRELEQFFINVVWHTGKRVTVEGWEGPKLARHLVDQAARAYERGAG
jgi:inorganic pyrophosphatase